MKNGYIDGTRDVENLVRLSVLVSQDACGVWIYRRILVSDVSGLVPLSTYRMAKIPGRRAVAFLLNLISPPVQFVRQIDFRLLENSLVAVARVAVPGSGKITTIYPVEWSGIE